MLHELLLNYITDMCNKKMNKHIRHIKQFVYSMYLLHRQGLLIVHTWFNSIFPSLKASSVWLYVALWSCLIEHGRMDWALIGERWKTSNYKKKHIWHISVLRVLTNLLNHPANISNDSPSFPGSLSLGNQIPQHLACNLHLQNQYPLTKRNKELVSETNW